MNVQMKGKESFKKNLKNEDWALINVHETVNKKQTSKRLN